MPHTLELQSLVFSTAVIVESVFQHLPAFDLCRCACVNKLWNNISTAVLNRRKRPVHFYQEYSDDQGESASYRGCSMKNAKTFEEEFAKQIRNLIVKPAFCIAFATCTLWENFEKFFPSHPIYEPKRMKFDKNAGTPRQRHLESIINTALKKHLPPNCQVCLYVGVFIIGIQRDTKKVVEQDAPAISGYVFPELPQQGIQFCRMRNYDCEEFRATATHKNLKSALVLMNYKTILYYTMKLKEIWHDLSETSIVFPVQIGSDVIPLFFGQNVKTFCFKTPFFDVQNIPALEEPIDEHPDIKNLLEALDEGKDVQAYQKPLNEERDIQVLQGPFYTDQNIQTLKELEKSGFLRRGTIAFMFAKTHYTSFIEFCEEFNKKYPHIPIAGLYGKSYKHKESEDDSKSKCLLISMKY